MLHWTWRVSHLRHKERDRDCRPSFVYVSAVVSRRPWAECSFLNADLWFCCCYLRVLGGFFNVMDILKTIPTHMDFDGQGRAEKYSRFIITLFGVVGLLWGYIIQQFSQTVYILGAGFVLAALVTIPPWPMYRRKSLQWQKPRTDSDFHNESAGKSKKKKN